MTSRFRALTVAVMLGAVASLAPRLSLAQTDEELSQARELFQEAYRDEQEHRFPEALEKFRRVAQVKESASVRYRIAAVLEAMKRYREARDAYRALAASKANLTEKDQPIAESAAIRAAELDKKIPRVVVTVTGSPPPADARVTVDGVPAPVGRPVEQDPGDHVVQANAEGMKPFEQHVTLPENNAEVPATVTFEPASSPPPSTPPPSRSNTLAYVALGAGGVLLTTGIILLVAREGAIADIEAACPNPSACPRAREPDVRDNEDQANLFLPLGVGLSVVGAAAVGAGVYLLVRRPSGDETRSAPAAKASAGGAMWLGPTYVRSGTGLGLTGTF